MAMTAPNQLNVSEHPLSGSRTVDCFEKLEQIGEGTYGLVQFPLILLFVFLLLNIMSWDKFLALEFVCPF